MDRRRALHKNGRFSRIYNGRHTHSSHQEGDLGAWDPYASALKRALLVVGIDLTDPHDFLVLCLRDHAHLVCWTRLLDP